MKMKSKQGLMWRYSRKIRLKKHTFREKKSRLQQDIDREILKALSSSNTAPDKDEAFCISVIPAVRRMSKEEKLGFRMGRLISFTTFNAQLLYSLTICMLHHNPRHVSSINMPIFGRTNCKITASVIVTLCKRLYSMPDESRAEDGHVNARNMSRVVI